MKLEFYFCCCNLLPLLAISWPQLPSQNNHATIANKNMVTWFAQRAISLLKPHLIEVSPAKKQPQKALTSPKLAPKNQLTNNQLDPSYCCSEEPKGK